MTAVKKLNESHNDASQSKALVTDLWIQVGVVEIQLIVHAQLSASAQIFSFAKAYWLAADVSVLDGCVCHTSEY